MSGKIIMKRKREEKFANRREADSSSSSSTDTSNEHPNTSCKRQCSTEAQPSVVSKPKNTPSTEALESPRNQLLIEALKRIVELQSELDEFEHDLEEHERIHLPQYDNDSDVSMYPDEVAELQRQEDSMGNLRRSEAESLGFAMCARETLMFLEREGVPSDSLLYRSLRSKLVGQTDGFIPI